MSNLYKQINIWKRKSHDHLVCYRCFELVSQNKYCVQSCDYIYKDSSNESINSFNDQFIELLLEEAPEIRSTLYDTIEEAVAAHDKDFEVILSEVEHMSKKSQ